MSTTEPEAAEAPESIFVKATVRFQGLARDQVARVDPSITWVRDNLASGLLVRVADETGAPYYADPRAAAHTGTDVDRLPDQPADDPVDEEPEAEAAATGPEVEDEAAPVPDAEPEADAEAEAQLPLEEAADAVAAAAEAAEALETDKP